MKIRLLADYRGVATEEHFYVAGEYEAGVDMPESHALALIADKRAEEIEPAQVEAPKPSRTANPKTTRRRAPRKKKAE